MDTTRQVYGQTAIDRVRSPGHAAKLTRQRARPEASCSNRPASPALAGSAGRTGVWADLAASGDDYVLVQVVGAVDIASRPELTDVLARAVDSGESAVIVDLGAVTLLAAAGIGCLRDAADRLAGRDRCLHLVCPPDGPAARVLRLVDLHSSWPLHPDVPAAVAMVEGRV